MDRDNVIKAIDICLRHGGCNDCPYCFSKKGYATIKCCDDMFRDALSLLKEQEAVEPVTESSVYDPDTWFFVCGSCKKGVIDRGDKFCRWCGQKVKWNE